MRWWRVLSSVLAAFFGVQKDSARAEDFKQAPAPFIIAGILLGIVFVISLVQLAQWITRIQAA